MALRNIVVVADSGSSSDGTDDESTDALSLHEQNGDSSIFNFAASGDLENLSKMLNTEGLSSVEISRIVTIVLSTDKTRKQRNILHLAARFLGDPHIAKECVRVVLKFARVNILETEYTNLVNAGDEDGSTPLYLAAKYENADACKVLLGGGSDLDQPNNRGKTPIMKLFKKLPNVLTDIFREKGSRSHFLDGERRFVNLHFRALISIPMEVDVVQRSAGLYREMDLLSNLSYTPLQHRAQLLKDTHVKTLVWIKWQHYKSLFWLTRIFQISWFLLYVSYLLLLYRVQCPFAGGKIYNFSWIPTEPSSSHFNYSETAPQLFSERECATSSLRIMGWILMVSAAVDGFLIEGYPTVVRFRRKWYPMKTPSLSKYIKQLIIFSRILHLEKLALLISIFMNTAPINFNVDFLSVEGQYVFASLGMFLACFHIFLQLGKFPQFKGYVKMFTNTIYTLCIVGMLYCSLIFAFAMVFCILLPGEATYSSPFEAIIRMSTFTIGEVDFEDTFYGDEASPPASFIVTTLFFGCAIIVLHISLLNFLIGLTINELQNVWKQAALWRTYTYLWQIYLCETFISNFPFPIFQKFLLNRMVLKCNYDKVSDLEKNTRKRFYKIRMDKLPKSIRKEIRQLNLPFIPNDSAG